MKWLGEKLKEIVKKTNFTQTQLSKELQISRQTYIDWTNGQVPKGHHLLKICRLLELNPTELFMEENGNIAVPLHMTRMNAKLTDDRQNASFKLIKEYENIIDYSKSSVLNFSITSIGDDCIPKLAQELRELAGLDKENTNPLDYHHIFKLLEKLDICLIFRKFPNEIKSYGFFTTVNNQKTVFINTSISVIDLIFPLLHELVHAIIDRAGIKKIPYKTEEDFCNKVAGITQFPENYVESVYSTIKSRPIAYKINTLKKISKKNHHAMYGIVKAIKQKYKSFKINVGGADTNLKKTMPHIKDILNHNDHPEEYLNNYAVLSPIFYELLLENHTNLTNRKLGEILDLDNSLDAAEIRKVLDRQKRRMDK